MMMQQKRKKRNIMGKCSDSFLFLLFLPEMSNFLIFTRQQDIRRISLEVEYYADVVVAGSLKNAIAIDVDVVEGNFLYTFYHLL